MIALAIFTKHNRENYVVNLGEIASLLTEPFEMLNMHRNSKNLINWFVHQIHLRWIFAILRNTFIVQTSKIEA